MALKFLNKKGWHTGSLRNIENVWKAEQKHEAEQKKLEELRKQIHEERERAEFRQLQEQAGLISAQDRLDFLYDSGLAVGKGSSSFKALESLPKTDAGTAASSSSSAAAAAKQQSAAPGALFEDKPYSANDSWRKLHSDPLLLIRRKEQEALARVKNNPIQMAMIRKSVESKKDKDKDEKRNRKEHRKKKSKRKHSESDSDSDNSSLKGDRKRENHHKESKSRKHSRKAAQNSDEELSDRDNRRKKYHVDIQRDSHHIGSRSDKNSLKIDQNSDDELSEGDDRRKKYQDKNNKDRRYGDRPDHKYDKNISEQNYKKSYYDSRSSEREMESRHDSRSHYNSSDKPPRPESNHRRRGPVKLSEEERAARLKEMQMDAERHEEQRWKRLKIAAATDAEEAVRDSALAGRNFLDTAHKSVYGTEKGGSSSIEESVRRRTHYSQGRSATDGNAFRR